MNRVIFKRISFVKSRNVFLESCVYFTVPNVMILFRTEVCGLNATIITTKGQIKNLQFATIRATAINKISVKARSDVLRKTQYLVRIFSIWMHFTL